MILAYQGGARIDVVPGGRLHPRATWHRWHQARVAVSSVHGQICPSFPQLHFYFPWVSSRQLGGDCLVANSLRLALTPLPVYASCLRSLLGSRALGASHLVPVLQLTVLSPLCMLSGGAFFAFKLLGLWSLKGPLGI